MKDAIVKRKIIRLLFGHRSSWNDAGSLSYLPQLCVLPSSNPQPKIQFKIYSLDHIAQIIPGLNCRHISTMFEDLAHRDAMDTELELLLPTLVIQQSNILSAWWFLLFSLSYVRFKSKLNLFNNFLNALLQLDVSFVLSEMKQKKNNEWKSEHTSTRARWC